MPPGIDADRNLLFSKGDVGIILQIMCVVESGGVVSFMQLRGDDVSAEMELNCGYMGTEMKKGSEKENESVTVHEDGGRKGTQGSLHGDICAEQESVRRRCWRGRWRRRCSAGAINKRSRCRGCFAPSSSSMHLLTTFFFSVHLAAAIIIPFRAFPSETVHLSKRSNVTGVPLQNGGNVIYGTNITLGGTSFNVVLDSGRCVYLYSLPVRVPTHIPLVPTYGLRAPFPILKTRERRSQYRTLSVMFKVRMSLTIQAV